MSEHMFAAGAVCFWMFGAQPRVMSVIYHLYHCAAEIIQDIRGAEHIVEKVREEARASAASCRLLKSSSFVEVCFHEGRLCGN